MEKKAEPENELHTFSIRLTPKLKGHLLDLVEYEGISTEVDEIRHLIENEWRKLPEEFKKHK